MLYKQPGVLELALLSHNLVTRVNYRELSRVKTAKVLLMEMP